VHCLRQIVSIPLSCSHTMLVSLLFIKRYLCLNQKKICFWKRHVSKFVCFRCSRAPSDKVLQQFVRWSFTDYWRLSSYKRKHTSVLERKTSVKKISQQAIARFTDEGDEILFFLLLFFIYTQSLQHLFQLHVLPDLNPL
jgi:hypothetical protein